MSLPTRACLAMALAWAGGFGLPGPPGVELLWIALALALGLWVAPAEPGGSPTKPGGSPTERSGWVQVGELLALALLLGLLARTLGRVVIAAPAAIWAIPVGALGLLALGRVTRGRLALMPAIVGVALAAGLFGASFEAAGPQPRGRVDGSPILGVHPRQAIAVRIDGFGPHDIIADDYVDPPGGQGYDPERWAARLEAELHAIAERNYADGPSRARVAYAEAEVEVREALVPPTDRDLYSSLLGVEVRSGTLGAGSRVEFVCPGHPLDPRGGTRNAAVGRSCPRKYRIDGSTGLGLAARFPGYTEVVGRDRARLARLLGWPSGDAKADRRSLALESGAWLLGLLLGTWLLGRRHPPSEARRGPAGAIAGALVLLLVIALVGPTEPSTHGGPTLLAILLVLAPATRRGEPTALPCALLLALLAASPLAGHGDALELLAITRDRLVDLGLGWSTAGAIAASLAIIPLLLGAEICAAALADRSRKSREGRHTSREWLGLGLAIALGLGLALRKPVDDLALLASAAALLLLATCRLRTRAQQLGLTLACTLAAVAPLLDGDVRTPIGLVVVGLGGLLSLALGVAGTLELRHPTQTSPGGPD